MVSLEHISLKVTIFLFCDELLGQHLPSQMQGHLEGCFLLKRLLIHGEHL